MQNLKETFTDSAFDSAALAYDNSFTHSWTGKCQREQVWKFLAKKNGLHNNASILEINCGTGEDAIRFARLGYSVEASDISSEMIAVAEEKARILKNEKLNFRVCDIKSLSSVYSGNRFDLIFSNFGGLNCLSPAEIKRAGSDFNKLLNDKGRIILVVMGRKCIWERLYFTFKGKSEQASRRRGVLPVSATIGSSQLAVWYYSPKELEALLKENFYAIRKKPVGIFIPPSYLEAGMQGKDILKKILQRLENLFGNFSFLSDYADHYLIEFRKV